MNNLNYLFAIIYIVIKLVQTLLKIHYVVCFQILFKGVLLIAVNWLTILVFRFYLVQCFSFFFFSNYFLQNVIKIFFFLEYAHWRSDISHLLFSCIYGFPILSLPYFTSLPLIVFLPFSMQRDSPKCFTRRSNSRTNFSMCLESRLII